MKFKNIYIYKHMNSIKNLYVLTNKNNPANYIAIPLHSDNDLTKTSIITFSQKNLAHKLMIRLKNKNINQQILHKDYINDINISSLNYNNLLEKYIKKNYLNLFLVQDIDDNCDDLVITGENLYNNLDYVIDVNIINNLNALYNLKIN